MREPGDDIRAEAVAVLERLGRAIAAGDPAAVIAEFWPAAEVTMFGSEGPEIAYGPTEVSALWHRVLARGQSYVWEWRNERVSAVGGVAWLTAEATVTIGEGPTVHRLPYRASLVLVEHAGRWMIAMYHGSEPAASW
jgi:uncharacterized protein (TIGR02246 family)